MMSKAVKKIFPGGGLDICLFFRSLLFSFLISFGVLFFYVARLVLDRFGRISASQLMFHRSLPAGDVKVSPIVWQLKAALICGAAAFVVLGAVWYIIEKKLRKLNFFKYIVCGVLVCSSLCFVTGVDSLFEVLPFHQICF